MLNKPYKNRSKRSNLRICQDQGPWKIHLNTIFCFIRFHKETLCSYLCVSNVSLVHCAVRTDAWWVGRLKWVEGVGWSVVGWEGVTCNLHLNFTAVHLWLLLSRVREGKTVSILKFTSPATKKRGTELETVLNAWSIFLARLQCTKQN